MRRLLPLVVLAAALLAGQPVRAALAPREPARPLLVGDGERLLVLAPHPDDESLGAGGLVQAVLSRGGTVRVVTFTAGDGFAPAVWLLGDNPSRHGAFLDLGVRRLAEERAALWALGGDAIRFDDLGFPDGGLGALLDAHFERGAPLRSTTTGESRVPYADAFRPGTPYTGQDLRDLLVGVLRDMHPTLVALPDPADQHPDHAATGEFGLLALVTAEAASPAAGPQAIHPRVLSYVVHWHDHPEGWKTGHDEKTAARPLALPADFPTRGLAPVALVLTHDQIARKRAALACHASERRVMGAYLDGFVRATEPYLLWDTGAVRAAVAARAKQRSITPKASLPTAPPASAAPPQAPRRPAGAKDAAPRVELPSS